MSCVYVPSIDSFATCMLLLNFYSQSQFRCTLSYIKMANRRSFQIQSVEQFYNNKATYQSYQVFYKITLYFRSVSSYYETFWMFSNLLTRSFSLKLDVRLSILRNVSRAPPPRHLCVISPLMFAVTYLHQYSSLFVTSLNFLYICDLLPIYDFEIFRVFFFIFFYNVLAMFPSFSNLPLSFYIYFVKFQFLFFKPYYR